VALSGRTILVAMTNPERVEPAMTAIQRKKEKEMILILFQSYEADFEQNCLIEGENANAANLWFSCVVNSIFGIHDDKQLNTLISHCVCVFCPFGICIFRFDALLRNGSLIAPILSVDFRMRNDLTNSFVISDWHFLLWLFPFDISGCDRVSGWVGIGIGIGIGMGERRELLFHYQAEGNERNHLFGSEPRGFVCDVDRFRMVLDRCGGSRFGSGNSSRFIEIDERCERIQPRDFEGYESVTKVFFLGQPGLKEISGFHGCTSLSRLEIPSSVEVIRASGFSGCTSLNAIVFSSGSHLRAISGFCGCTSLSRVEIPSLVEVIGDSAFSVCISLNAIVFSSGSHLRAISGFRGCTSLSRVEIPSSVEVIGDFAFRECTSLTTIVFSSGSHLKEISAFRGCTSLSRVEIPSSVEVIGCYGFEECTSLNAIVFSSGSHLKELFGFCGCTSLSRVEIPSSVEVIGRCGFSGCPLLNAIVFSSRSHLKELSGFCGCTSLSRVEIPSSVEEVSGFQSCISLRLVILQAGCRVRGSEGFRHAQPFILHDDEAVKSSRRLFHLGTH
jgi:hypothetical protein